MFSTLNHPEHPHVSNKMFYLFSIAYFGVLLRQVTYLHYILNNFYVYYPILAKFAENVGIIILIAHTEYNYFCLKITPAIR